MEKPAWRGKSVSCVSYLNSIPYVFGIRNSGFPEKYELTLSLDTPDVCLEKVVSGAAVLGLVPVAAFSDFPALKRVGSFGIGAGDNVSSVLLCSPVPTEKIEKILLDPESRTSARLIKILCRDLWKINPVFETAMPGYEENISGTTAGLIIGDRALAFKEKFRYSFDLAHSWKILSGKPFLFAAWATQYVLPQSLSGDFEKALDYGCSHIEPAILSSENRVLSHEKALKYLTGNIQFRISPDFEAGLKEFLDRSHGI
jgi:chorismate dehydratase